MDVLERLVGDVLGHVRAARAAAAAVASVSDDWTAKVILAAQFDRLEQAVRSFGRHQLGVKSPSTTAVSRWPHNRPRA
jgi:hypothetical protein